MATPPRQNMQEYETNNTYRVSSRTNTQRNRKVNGINTSNKPINLQK